MGSWFGSLLGGVSSLVGGWMNTQNAAQMNAANIANQDWIAGGGYLPALVRNAGRAGLSPLAVLGKAAVEPVSQVGTQPGAGLEAFGQDLARAAAASSEGTEKAQVLDASLKQAQIDNVNASTVTQQLKNSQMVTAFAQPGTPMGIPLPRPNPQYEEKVIPQFARDTAGNIWPSKEVTERSFSWLPGMAATARDLGSAWSQNFPGSDYDDYIARVRPDVARAVEMVGSAFPPQF